VAVQAIKTVARRRYAGAAPPGSERHSWYEPLRDPGAISRAVGSVLDHPQLFLISSAEFEVLGSILEAAAGRGPRPADDELAADVAEYSMAPLFDGAALERI
jgi:hypothetical protein